MKTKTTWTIYFLSDLGDIAFTTIEQESKPTKEEIVKKLFINKENIIQIKEM